MHIRGFLAGAAIMGTVAMPLHSSGVDAATGSAVIHLRMSGAFTTSATLTGPSSTCQLAYFPATKGKSASPASSILLIGHNTGGVSAKPPAADAFAMELVDYKPALQSYTDDALLSVVLSRHSYLFSIIDSTAMTVHTSDGGHTGSFQAVGLKPNNGTKGGKVNASGTWTCSGFQKVTIKQP